MTARLASGVLVSALIRRVFDAGGHAAVLHKGDPKSGSILLILMDKGQLTSVRERLLGAGSSYAWEAIGPSDADAIDAYLERRRSRDPDLWLLELDIPQAERFVAETSGIG